jgi:integrase
VSGHAIGRVRPVIPPARWRGHLDKLLPARSKVRRVEHHAALPYAELPGFLVSLREQEGIASRALEFAILTAARTGEVIGAQWSEMDLLEKTWTLPAGRITPRPLIGPSARHLRRDEAPSSCRGRLRVCRWQERQTPQ